MNAVPTIRRQSASAGERRSRLYLFLILLLCYVYFLPRWADPNQNSRLDMIMAIVDDGTFQIDRYVQNTVDYARVGEHYYSDKAPGAAFLAVPVYAALKPMLNHPSVERLLTRLSHTPAFQATLQPDGTGLLVGKVRLAVIQMAAALVTAALPTALLGILMYVLLAQFTDRPWPRLLVALGYGLLTPAFPYAGAFYGHQLSAAGLFAAFVLVFAGKKPLTNPTLLGIGLLLGYSIITEYPVALIAGILFLYTLYRLDAKWRIGWVILAGSIVAAGWMCYNTVVFGGPLTLGYGYSELWQKQHHTGFMSLTLPHWDALWGIAFSPFRGLFVLSPLLLLAVLGLVLWWRSGKHHPEFWVVLASVVAMLAFNSTSGMWWGGFAVGPRYLLPMLPFFVLPLIFVFCEGERLPWLWGISAALALWSLVATWGLTLAGQAFPSDTIGNPLVEYAWPHWCAGDIARNLGMALHLRGVASLLPLFVIVGVLFAGLILSTLGDWPASAVRRLG